MIDFAMPDNIIAMPQKSNEWYTPARYVEVAREVMGSIDLDPASCELANRTVKAIRYYTQRDNGLAKEWHGNVWLNPPYGLVTPGLRGSTKSLQAYFAKELLRRYQAQEIEQAIVLLFAPALGMPWFQPFWEYPVCIARHRVVFNKPDGTQDYYGFGNVFIYLGSNEAKFIEVFSKFGRIAKAIDTPRQTVQPLSLWGDA